MHALIRVRKTGTVVPDLTFYAGIKLNERVLLKLHKKTLRCFKQMQGFARKVLIAAGWSEKLETT